MTKKTFADAEYEQWADDIANDNSLSIDPEKVVYGRYDLDGNRGNGGSRVRQFRISDDLDNRVESYIQSHGRMNFSDLVKDALEDKIAS